MRDVRKDPGSAATDDPLDPDHRGGSGSGTARSGGTGSTGARSGGTRSTGARSGEARRDALATRPLLPLVAVAALLLVTVACRSDDPRASRPINHEPRIESEAVLPHYVPASQTQTELYERARAAWAAGDRGATLAAIEPLMQTPQASREKVYGAILYAELLALDGRAADAIALLDQVALETPPNGDVYFLMARVYLDSGQLEQAIEALRNATRAAPDLLRAWIALSALLAEGGATDEAEEIMIHYEREVYRLGHVLDSPAPVDEKLDVIAALHLAVPDPRISRILARTLNNDAIEVQRAALEALAEVGTRNAAPALQRMRESSSNVTLRARAQEVLEIVRTR